jgi:pteridine reductase
VKKTAERIIYECLETWGRLDVLVNNAAQFYPTEIGKESEEIWNDLIQTNMSAPYFLSQVG